MEILLFVIFSIFLLFGPFFLLPRLARINIYYKYIAVAIAFVLFWIQLSFSITSPSFPDWLIWRPLILGYLYELISYMFLSFVTSYPLIFYVIPLPYLLLAFYLIFPQKRDNKFDKLP